MTAACGRKSVKIQFISWTNCTERRDLSPLEIDFVKTITRLKLLFPV